MNLKSIYLLCKRHETSIRNLKATNISVNGRNGKRVEGWGACRNAIEELQTIAALEEECTDLLEAIPSFFRTRSSFDILDTEWKQIIEKRDCLYRTMIDIIDLCEKMGISNDDSVGLDIKLPPYNDFSEFVKYVNDIEFILSKCPFLSNEEEKLEFKNVDVGSTWLTFVITGTVIIAGASVLLNNIAAFADKCIIIRSHYLTTQKQKQDLEMQKKNDSEKEIIIKYIDGLYANIVEQAIKELEEITGYTVENNDGDEKMRIVQCIERMGALIEKGLQIYAAVDSPEESKALFKPLEMKYLEYQKRIDLLEEKEGNDEE